MAIFSIGAPNYLEPNLAALTLGSFTTTGPRDNLADPDLGNPAITTDATTTSTQVAIDLTAITTLRGEIAGADALFIPRTNLTQNATITVKAGSAAFTSGGSGGGTVAYNSGAIAALTQAMYPSGYTNAWGRNNANTPDPLMDGAYNRGVLVLFGATKRAPYWWVGISDTSNPDGYVSLSRMFLGPLWSSSVAPDLGFTMSLEGSRSSTESATNAEYIDPHRRLRRVVTFQTSNLPLDESLSVFFPLASYLGYAKQALFIFDQTDTYHMARRAFLVTQQKAGAFAYRNYPRVDVPMVLQEVI